MGTDTKLLRRQLDDNLERAREITRKAERANRGLTGPEREEAERIIAKAAVLRDAVDAGNDGVIRDQLDTLSGGPSGGTRTGLLSAFKSAGWEPGKKAAIPATAAFKTASWDGSTATRCRPLNAHGSRARRSAPTAGTCTRSSQRRRRSRT